MESLNGAGVEPFKRAVSEILSATAESDVCRLAVEYASVIFDASLVGMWLYDADTRELQLTAQTETADRLLGTDIVYEPGNSASWKAFENGEVFRFTSDAAGEKYNTESVVESEIIVPVGEYGVINIGSETSKCFSDEDIELAKTFGTVVENALDHIDETHALRVKNDRLEEVISLVSHDLRNPLNVAQGRVDYISRMTDDQLLLEQVDTTTSSLERMETLIEDLLMLAEQGYVVEERTSLTLDELASDAWENVDTRDASLEATGEKQVFGERKRLLQIFENLFRNAVEHGGTDVTVNVRPIELFHTSTRGGDEAESDGFIVEDDGDGLPEKDDFDLFESGTSTSGSGLGLTIAERIIEAHGWDIDAGDSPHGGAQFKITAGEKAVMPFK